MTAPLVSIIVPVYNSEQYLKETLESAKTQSWSNKEIIIIDDGSTDSSLDIAKGFACDWMKVFQQVNKGASAARNFGLREAKGTYIQFLDSDDIISSDKLEEQINLLKDTNDTIALCSTINFVNKENLNYGIKGVPWYSNGSSDPIDFLIKLYGGN